jgi:ankyrin repeat protein
MEQDIFEDYCYTKKYEFLPNFSVSHISKLLYLLLNINVLATKLSKTEDEIKQVIINYLCTHKEEVNMCGDYGLTPLHVVATNNKSSNLTNVLISLLENGADVNLQGHVPYKWTALILACYYIGSKSDIETIKILLEHNANTNMQDGLGWTALMGICRNPENPDKIEAVKLLLEYGTDVNVQNYYGGTSLMIACDHHNIKIAELLLEHKANIDIQDIWGWSVLMIACRETKANDDIKIIELLLKYGANVDLQNYKGRTALVGTYRKNTNYNINIILILLDYGADYLKRDMIDMTPLHYLFTYITNVSHLKKIINRICEIKHYKFCMDATIKKILGYQTGNTSV